MNKAETQKQTNKHTQIHQAFNATAVPISHSEHKLVR